METEGQEPQPSEEAQAEVKVRDAVIPMELQETSDPTVAEQAAELQEKMEKVFENPSLRPETST